MLRELDCVALTVDLPEFGLHRGDVGAIVLVNGEGHGYEVEFVNNEGDTLAVVTLHDQQVRQVEVSDHPDQIEVPHVSTGPQS